MILIFLTFILLTIISVPIIKILSLFIKMKKDKKSINEYKKISEIIISFLKKDNNRNKYPKESKEFIDMVFNHISSSDPIEKQSKEIFKIFEDIIPEFKIKKRNTKLDQILK